MINEKQLHRYFLGLSSEEESTLILRWLSDADADHRILEKYMASQWQVAQEAILKPSGDQVINNLRNRLYPEVPAITPPAKINWFRNAAAACVIGILIISGFYFTNFFKANRNSSTIQWVEIKNENLETISAILPDNSSAWLSSGSRLFYDNSFLKSAQRQVRVEGEVFFDVAHIDDQPFLVYTGNIHTKVLGTAFNVEAYPQEPDIRISVVRGKVAVQKNTDILGAEILKPGETLSWDRKDNHINRGNFSQTNIDEWKKGFFIFNDIPLSSALERIASRYQLTIKYCNEAEASRVKITTILKHDHLIELLQVFPFITPFDFNIQNKVLSVTRRKNHL